MTDRHRVGIVVVSHSRVLAQAAVGLATQMLHGQQVAIAVAAGLEDGSLGTNALQIKTALEQVDNPAGVVVLMDLGSAILSTETALELLSDPAARDRVVLSPAPLVEGLVVAAVAAVGGADRDAVAAEAAGALLAKWSHLGSPAPRDTPPSADDTTPASVNSTTGPATTGPGATAVLIVLNQHGLHARPAARLVEVATAAQARVQVRNLTTGAGPVPAGSLSRVATLAALCGHRLEVHATGPQAQQAVTQLLALAARNFDEGHDDREDAAGTALVGSGAERSELSSPPFRAPEAGQRAAPGPLAASPGIGIGVAHPIIDPLDAHGSALGSGPDGAASALDRIVEATTDVRREIEELRRRTLQDVGAEEASIFDAHLALLADPELLGNVETRLLAGVDVIEAWTTSLLQIEQQWARLPDPYLSARATDVRAVSGQVLRALTGVAAPRTPSEGVLVARDLGPAETASLDGELVKGVVLAQGSPSSHAAILARARGIPMVVGAGDHVLTVAAGTQLVLDGGTGEVHVDPDPEIVEIFQQRRQEFAARRAGDLAPAALPALTLDGEHVHVAANVGSVADAAAAAAAGAYGAGLVRSELLFLGRAAPPTPLEQEREYSAIAEAMHGQRITLRTLDVGGDKPLPYVAVPVEQNPFLGLRGIRLTLDRPELFRDQLAAICHTGRQHPISVMFPMVSTVDELLAARRLLADAAGPHGLPSSLRVGMMIEVPAAALKIEQFLPHLDFASIGTNDLTQYALAAERGNPSVASLSDGLDPAVLQLIGHVCDAAHGRADVAVCGEAAADETSVPVLVGLGVRELSVSPRAVPAVKAALRRLDTGTCRELAEKALTLPGPEDVRALVQSFLASARP